jgi:steroid delta-isomerase-like uncharacterized protein
MLALRRSKGTRGDEREIDMSKHTAHGRTGPVLRWVHEVLNEKRAEVAHEILAPDYEGHFARHAAPEPVRGPDAYVDFIGAIHRGFPDVSVRIDDLVEAGEDKVVARLTMRATHLGEYKGIPPTRRRCQATMTVVFRLADGRIAETWQEVDALGMMQQLGVAPPVGVGPVRFLGWALGTIARMAFFGMRESRRTTRRAETAVARA